MQEGIEYKSNGVSIHRKFYQNVFTAECAQENIAKSPGDFV